eukprot:2938187-Alexandrium_andersonii.AAC.1
MQWPVDSSFLKSGIREDAQMAPGVSPMTSSGHPLVVKLFRIVLDPTCERVKACLLYTSPSPRD